MDKLFYVLGVISFIVICGVFVLILRQIWEETYDLRRRYHDYCWLSNVGWPRKEFDTFMKTERQEMTKEQALEWKNKNTRFYYKWICFKKMKQEPEVKTTESN